MASKGGNFYLNPNPYGTKVKMWLNWEFRKDYPDMASQHCLCNRLNNVSSPAQGDPHPNLWICTMIKLKIFRWEDYPVLSVWAWYNHNGPYLKETGYQSGSGR